MKRISLIAAGALACLLIASVGTAVAGGYNSPPEAETPKVDTSCTTTSKNVTTKNVAITVAGKNVAESQMKFAECPTVKKVANKMLSLRIEKPKVFEGFRCTPSVVHTEPDVVKYSCLFRGADTSTEIRLKFTANYDMD
jgi:hypothetical protein